MPVTPWDAYADVNLLGLPQHELEAAVFRKAARQLEECFDRWGAEGHAARLSDALEFNQRLWTFFCEEVSQPNHPLAAGIRQNLLWLGLFVERRSEEIRAEPLPEKLSALININLKMVAGLVENPAKE